MEDCRNPIHRAIKNIYLYGKLPVNVFAEDNLNMKTVKEKVYHKYQLCPQG